LPSTEPLTTDAARIRQQMRWRQEWMLMAWSVAFGLLLQLAFRHVEVALVGAAVIYAASLLFRVLQVVRATHQHHWGRSVMGLPGLIQDRHRRMRASWYRRQRRLVSLLKRYHHSAMSVPDAMIVLTTSGEIEWLNRAASELLAIARRDIGLRIDNLIRTPGFIQWFKAGPSERPLEMDAPADTRRSVSLRMEPYGNDRILLIGRDVTALHRLQGVRQDFVANVSHELRTPLTVLAGYIETLIDTDDDPDGELHKILLNMEQQSDRMRRIVEDLLLLSRLETSRPDEELFEAIDMQGMLDLIANDARQVSGDEQHRIVTEVDQDANLVGVHRELHSALSNLVFNAVKYTPAGGTVTVRWYVDEDGRPVFEVQDTGIGIEPRHIPRLTERFYRIDVGRSRARGGTGLGLAIVKHVVLRHDAHLEIESEPGHGSTFRVRFPARRLQRRKA